MKIDKQTNNELREIQKVQKLVDLWMHAEQRKGALWKEIRERLDLDPALQYSINHKTRKVTQK